MMIIQAGPAAAPAPSPFAPAIALFAAVVAAALTYYCYVHVIGNNLAFRSIGILANPPAPYSVLLALGFCFAPLLWLQRSIVRPSDFIILYLYVFLFIPTCIMMPFVSRSGVWEQFLFLLCASVSFLLLQIIRYMRPLPLRDLSITEPVLFEWIILSIGLIGVATLFLFGTIDFSNISFLDVYERRLVLLAENTGGSIVFYTANWAALAVSPLLIIYGLDQRRLMMVGVAVAVAGIAFLATSFKSHLSIPIFTAIYYLSLRFFGLQWSWVVIVLSAILISAISLLIDAAINDIPLVTWSLQFRLIGNNGFLSAHYLDFFYDMPKGLFADSFGRFFTEPNYPQPIAIVVGEGFSGVRDNHANANLWADGFGNLGFAGILFAGLELMVFLWLLDSVAAGKRLILGVAAGVPLAFSLANTSVHSTITSNGALLLLLLLMLMPTRAGAAPPDVRAPARGAAPRSDPTSAATHKPTSS